MGNSVSLTIKLTDNGSTKKISADIVELGRAVRRVQDEAQNARRTIIKWAEVSQAFDVLHNTINELQNVVTDLTNAYHVQIVAETQLNTIMRQRMNATDQEVQSIKDLCSAQQELGVVGDEVQLSGAQQMATFLQNKQSLDVLIPAMNNLIAQQEGLNASTSGAVSIGNMMGKAMQGQVEVLQRVGITFTDAQKQVLQYGTESERAAMLAQVITDNVGNMNAELAKTDAGKQKQLENNLGDIKEQLGGMVQRLAPAITMLSQVTMAATGIGKLSSSIYATFAAIKNLSVSMNVAKNIHASMVAVSRELTASYKGQAIGATTASVATRALSLAIKGLLVATGVGVAIVALISIIGGLSSASDKAAESAIDMAQAEQNAANSAQMAYDSTLKQTYGDMMARYEQLKAGWKALRSEHEKRNWIQKNRAAFDELRIKISSVGDAEAAFEKNTQTVVDGFAKRAQAAAYAAKLTELYQRQIALCDKKNNIIKAIASDAKSLGRNAKEGDIVPESWRSKRYGSVGQDGQWRFTKVGAERYNGTNTSGNKQVSIIDNQIEQVGSLIDDTKKQMAQIGKQSGWITPTPTTATNTPTTTTTTTPVTPDPLRGSIDYYEKQITELRKCISASADEGVATAMQTELEQKEAELKQLKIRIGIEKPEPKEVKSRLEEMQDLMAAEQHNFDNAATIDAKIKISTNIAKLQAQIDEETFGNITISANVQPTYVKKGSIEDKRQSYTNAEGRLGRIKRDYEIGLIGKADAEKQVKELNTELADLGLKPIKFSIDVERGGFDKAMADIRNTWGNVEGVGSGIVGMTEALDGNKSAWERISGVINSTLQIAEGISGIVKLIDMLTTSTEAETAATAVNTTITAANTGVSATNTAAKSGEAVANATASGAKLPFPANLVAIAAGVAAVVGALGMISGAFADGGIVGGSSWTGDKLMARVNSGEMILNGAQQSRLFAIANGATVYGAASGVGRGSVEGVKVIPATERLQAMVVKDSENRFGGISLRLRGSDLVGVIANETRGNRRRSNIRI